MTECARDDSGTRLLGFGGGHVAVGAAAERDDVGEHGLTAAAAWAGHAFFRARYALGATVLRVVSNEKMTAPCTAFSEFTHLQIIRENRPIG
jgi:hypothetical protein